MTRQPAPPERSYFGTRHAKSGRTSVSYQEGGRIKPLSPRADLHNHSDGFQWGYAGSGPAQLALALIANSTGDDELALRVYQQFKAEYIALIRDDNWSISAGEIVGWIEALQMDEDASCQ